jgi:hypothetical protein
VVVFHASCPKWDKTSDLPRLELLKQNLPSIRLYRCELCETLVSMNMDWQEGAIIEPEATFK